MWAEREVASPLLDRMFKATGGITLRYYHQRQRSANYHLPFCDFKQAKTVRLHFFKCLKKKERDITETYVVHKAYFSHSPLQEKFAIDP